MRNKSLIGLAVVIGIIAGALISPLNAQQQTARKESTCFVGEGSGAACIGNWIYFAGNTSLVDDGAWVVRMNGETGQVWYKKGKKLVLLEEPD